MAAIVEASRAADCPYEVVLVVSNVPDAAGLAFAQAAGIATATRSHKGIKRPEFDAWIESELAARGVEWIALAGYMRLLSPEFIAGREGRIVNIHPSLLPAYKGLDTHGRAIADGATRHGCSVHIVTPALDDGPVIAQAEVPVLPGDTPESLADRVLVQEHRLYPDALARLIREHRRSPA